MTLFQPGTLLLVVVAALGYAIATIGMKLGSVTLSAMAIGIVMLGFLMAAWAEIIILRKADLGLVYITIIGVETLVVLAYASWIGEGLSLRQIGGAGMVLAGLAVVAH